MKISKLNYTDKETAIADLLAKGVYIETEEGLSYGKGIHAIVELGNVITEPVYADGYAYDVMSEQEIVFESEVFPNSPVHNFAGCKTIIDEQGTI